jgi:hypothetical protein
MFKACLQRFGFCSDSKKLNVFLACAGSVIYKPAKELLL